MNPCTFSPCRRYRYTLRHEIAGPLDALLGVQGRQGCVAFVMLNPSTADEQKLDPTLRRCRGFAQSWGFAAFEVVNVFALRSTNPLALYEHSDPVGPENDEHIVRVAKASELVVCAWGVHGVLNGRGGFVLRMLRDAGVVPHALRMTADGFPSHPLYLPRELRPVPMEES